MADAAVAAGLNAVPLVTNHYHKVWNPIQNQYRRLKGDVEREDPHIRDHRSMEEKGYVLRRRSQIGSDEEIVDTVRHRGEVKGRRPGRMDRRSSSMDAGRPRGYAGGYDSEGSVPPRSRVRAKSQGGKSRNKGSSSSSTSTSDIGSSSGEEKECRKMARKKWITAGLASIATIHAAQKVYSSIEAHDKRIIEVQQGKISPEEAHKKQRSARWQDAAAIGIAALGIKGALSEWNEVQEEHKEHKELMEKRQLHHQKRLEKMRRDKAAAEGGYYKGRDGQWYYSGSAPQDSERSQLDGPRNGERKLLEGPSSKSRTRSVYDADYDDRTSYRRDDNGRSRRYTESRYGDSRYADSRRGSNRYDRDNYD